MREDDWEVKSNSSFHYISHTCCIHTKAKKVHAAVKIDLEEQVVLGKKLLLAAAVHTLRTPLEDSLYQRTRSNSQSLVGPKKTFKEIRR